MALSIADSYCGDAKGQVAAQGPLPVVLAGCRRQFQSQFEPKQGRALHVAWKWRRAPARYSGFTMRSISTPKPAFS
jgi:hypothetical protein